jgi:F420-dependent oxidoreductase-like protein
MKLGLMVDSSPAQFSVPMEQIKEAEQLGFDSVWTFESYGADAVAPAAWILAQTSRIKVGTAIMQMAARTPTCAAMTAMTLSAMSGNRFILGIGPSGPGVIEGWHGVPYGRPLTRTREYISIIRKIIERKERLEHTGFHYQIPYVGEGAKGLGTPMKSILHGDPNLKIYTAAITPNGLRCSGEVADGVFPIWIDPDRFDLIGTYLEEGFASSATEKSFDNFEVSPLVNVVLDDDLDKCRQTVKMHLALYIGGMGPRGHNFYNDYASRMGYEAEARCIQDLYLSGKKVEAAAAVPDQLVDDCALVGCADRIRDQLRRWRDPETDARIGTLVLSGASVAAMRLLAEELL